MSLPDTIYVCSVLVGQFVCRPSELATEVGQILERCYKQSRAVDRESLCIVAGEKVCTVTIYVYIRIVYIFYAYIVYTHTVHYRNVRTYICICVCIY